MLRFLRKMWCVDSGKAFFCFGGWRSGLCQVILLSRRRKIERRERVDGVFGTDNDNYELEGACVHVLESSSHEQTVL